ncbi:MAG TPA: T9SS type A sorting domain-containing protein, partial [Cyclobacteriaceae bacterium]|nr:T9SS type A sorting domain-containing protein [Cyclobacteriaceae bacterium]
VADVVLYDSVVITLQDGVLVSNYSEGNQWLLDGEELPGERNGTLVPSGPGIYSVVVALGACELQDQFDYVVTGVSEKSVLNNVMIYPSPCIDRLFIRFRPEINIEIMDVLSSSGISVNYLCTVECNNEICEMNTSCLPNGLYIMSLTEGQNSYQVRFVKHD